MMGSNEIECLTQEVSDGVLDGRQKNDHKKMEIIKSQGEDEKFGGTSSEDDESVQVSPSSRRGLCLILLSKSLSFVKQLIVITVK